MNVLSARFWFSNDPFLQSTLIIGLIFFVFLLIVAIWAKMKSRKMTGNPMRGVYGRLYGMALTMGITGLVMLFFSWQRVLYLGMRVLYVFWLAGFAYWGYLVYKRIAPAKALGEKQHKGAEMDKYMPKPKK